MIRLLLIDDHLVVRAGLTVVLECESDFVVVGAAASAEEALQLAVEIAPDVIVLDLEMPSIAGAGAIAPLLERWDGARIVVYTAYETDERVIGALRAGARAYVLKGASALEIAAAIRDVHRGGVHLEPSIAARVVTHMSAPRWMSGLLTPREGEVLRLVARGMPNKQIAQTLGIAETTVKYHLVVVFRKLGAENRAQAVALAVEKGLL